MSDTDVKCSICGEWHPIDRPEGSRNDIIVRWRHDIAALKAKVVELEASVKRNQEWLQQKSNEKVEALNKLAIAEHERDIWHEKYDALLDEKIAKGRFIEFRKAEP